MAYDCPDCSEWGQDMQALLYQLKKSRTSKATDELIQKLTDKYEESRISQ